MAFCLCLIVISAVLSAVQGKSGPINGSRETPTSPCQSIYSFQKLDFENLKNSLNEGDNDQVFTGLAYDSVSGRVFLSSPKVSGRPAAVTYFRIEDYKPGSQPRLTPFPHFESGPLCDEESDPKEIDDDPGAIYENADVQQLMGSGRKLLGIGGDRDTDDDDHKERKDDDEKVGAEGYSGRDSRSSFAGANRVARTRFRNRHRNGDQEEVVYVDLQNDRNRVPDHQTVYNYNRVISSPQINYDSEEQWPTRQIFSTGSFGGGNHNYQGSGGRQRNRKHGGQDASVVVVHADTSDWNLGQYNSDRIHVNGGSGGGLNLGQLNLDRIRGNNGGSGGGYVVVNGDDAQDRWSSTVIDTDNLPQTSLVGSVGDNLFSSGSHGNRLNRVRERGHKRRKGGQVENIVVVLNNNRHRESDDGYYEQDHYQGHGGHSSSYGFGGHGSHGYYLGGRLGRSAWASDKEEKPIENSNLTIIDPKPVHIDESLVPDEESMNSAKPNEELSADEAVVEATEGPVSGVGRRLLSVFEDDGADEDDREEDLAIAKDEASGAVRSGKQLTGGNQWTGANQRPQTAYDRLLERLLRRTQRKPNNANRRKNEQEREPLALPGAGYGNGYYVIQNRPNQRESVKPVSGFLPPEVNVNSNAPFPIRVVKIGMGEYNRGQYFDRNHIPHSHPSGYQWPSYNRFEHDKYTEDIEINTQPERFSEASSLEQPERKHDRFSDSEELGRSVGNDRYEYKEEDDDRYVVIEDFEEDEEQLAEAQGQDRKENIESRNANSDSHIDRPEGNSQTFDKVVVVDLRSRNPERGYVAVNGRSHGRSDRDSGEGWSTRDIYSDRLRRRRTRGRKRAQEQDIVLRQNEDDEANDNYYSPGGYNYDHRFDRGQRTRDVYDHDGYNDEQRYYTRRRGRSELTPSSIHNNSVDSNINPKDPKSDNGKDQESATDSEQIYRPGRKLLSISEEEDEEEEEVKEENLNQSEQRSYPHVSVYALRVDNCRRLWILDTGVDESGYYQAQCTDPSISVYDISSMEPKLLRKSQVPNDLFNNATGFQNIVVYSTCEDAVAYIANTVDKTILEYTFSTNIFKVVLNMDGASNDHATQVGSAAIQSVAAGGQWPIDQEWIKNVNKDGEREENSPPFSSTSAIGTFKNIIVFGDSKTNSIKCLRREKESKKAQMFTVFQDKDHVKHLHAMSKDSQGNAYILSNEWPLFVSERKEASNLNYSIVRCNMKLLIEGTGCDDFSSKLNPPMMGLNKF